VVYLIAQGYETQNRWKRPLPAGEVVLLGRCDGLLAVTWDKKVSRRHAELLWQRGVLQIQKIPTARNAITYRNQEAKNFEIRPGEQFQIGETTFTLADDQLLGKEPPPPDGQKTYAFQEIQAVRYRDADFRIDVLAGLPDLISGADDDGELFVRLVKMLMTGLPRADGVALVAVEESDEGPPKPRLMNWDRRRADRSSGFRPSEQLILEATRKGRSVSYVWTGAEDSANPPDFTMIRGIDWSFCTPVGGEGAEGWAIYVFGKFGLDGLPGLPSVSSPDLLADLKFTELVASVLGALREVRRLQRQKAVLEQCFSRVVIKSLAGRDPEIVLIPRETSVSVLFCDLRGFSREAEQNADDLMGLLKRVSEALGVMTSHIMKSDGVVGDFQGDAAMGFWGWPIDQGDSAARACLAALAIRTQFEANARTEGLLPPERARFRRLAVVRPYGMDQAQELTELLPPEADWPQLKDEHIRAYESGLGSFIAGRWSEARVLLARVSDEDQGVDYLRVFMARFNRTPPPQWDGVIPMDRKD
jgi:adenylate cyclase